jgi:PAS domain S-box-containing protein
MGQSRSDEVDQLRAEIQRLRAELAGLQSRGRSGLEIERRNAENRRIREKSERYGQAEEAARVSQDQLRLMVEQAPVTVAMFDRQMNYIATSKRWVAEYARGHTDLTGLNHYEVKYDMPDYWRQVHQKALAGIPQECEEDKWIMADGTVNWLRWAVHPWRDGRNEIGGIIISAENITARKQAEEALRESEQRFRELVEQAPDAIVVHDVDLDRWVSVNKSAERLFGCSREELLAGGPLRFYPAEQPDGLLPEESTRDHIRRALAGEQLVFQRAIHNACGEDLICEMRLVRQTSTEHRLLRASLVDITERKQAEEALQESEQAFRSLAEAMPQMVWATRVDGWNIYFNQQWVEYTGLTLEESYGHGWNTPFHPDDRQRAWDAWQNAIQNSSTYSLECRLRRADGTYRWWLVRGVPLRDANGKILKWFGTCTDIEDIKQAEEKLKQSERLLRESQIIAGLGSYVLDVPTGVWSSSEGLDKVLGINYSYERSVEGWVNLIHPDDRTMMGDYLKNDVVGKGRTFNKEYRIIRHKDQAERWVHGMGKMEYDDQRRPIRMHGTIQDITERKQAEEALRKAKIDAEVANQAKDRFIAVLSPMPFGI